MNKRCLAGRSLHLIFSASSVQVWQQAHGLHSLLLHLDNQHRAPQATLCMFSLSASDMPPFPFQSPSNPFVMAISKGCTDTYGQSLQYRTGTS